MSGKKLSTANIKAGGEGVVKVLQPGNQMCTVNAIRLEEFKFKPGSYHLILNLEGPDMGPEFEGFHIDKTNEALGRHKGQVAEVKSTLWAYADGETKSKIAIYRDDEILKFLKNFCVALGINDWLLSQDDKHDTIESLILAFNADKPFKGKAMEYCIGGKEYMNKNNYLAYDLFLPKYTKAGAPYGMSKVVKFNEEDHIIKKKVETVTEFGAEAASTLGSEAPNDFNLD